jgi:tRNA threonylcarbamoyladenosine biosynthesis protein TsaE
MGAGKTTLIKAIAKKLGVKDMASSPTFSLVNEYATEEGQVIYHFDLYRLNSEEEAYDMGIDEYFYSGNLCLIEWPEKTPNLIPLDHTAITIRQLQDDKRQVIAK